MSIALATTSVATTNKTIEISKRCAIGAVGLASALTAFLAPSRAHALDLFEIQIYEADVNRPWQPGLEVHTNYTFAGNKSAEYSGQEVPHQATRLTLEPALGITEFLEVGAYLQNLLNREGEYRFAGFKLRTKFVIPKRYTGRFFFGLNAEIGKVPRAVEAEGWANEFRPIIGYYNGNWLFDVNPIFGYALSGKERFRPDLEPGGKIGFNTQHGFMVGTEYYAGLGLLTSVSPISEQSHLLFLTFDLVEPKGATAQALPPSEPSTVAKPHEEEDGEWELNVGLGRSLTDATPQHWILKTIVGRAF